MGTASFIVRARLPRLRTGWLPLGNADRIYDATLRGLEFVAFKVTGATQRGSIPATQSVILLTLVVLCPSRCWRSAPATARTCACGRARCSRSSAC